MTKIVKALWSMPEWALKLNQARELCKAHYIGGVQAGCANCVRREDGFKNVIAQAYKVYGNPFRKKDRRIQVGRK